MRTGIEDEQQLENTKRKLALLAAKYEEARCRPSTNTYARTLSLRSLKRMMNQFQEEIVRYQAGPVWQTRTTETIMIPPFDDNGYLPPGIHPATLDEIAERFGTGSEIREAEMESLRWLVDLARRAGVKRIIVNGSFVTDRLEPNDVDCVLLVKKGFDRKSAAAEELKDGLPFLQYKLVSPKIFAWYTQRLYASDETFVPKGMIEVVP
jgi:uncharacterized protein DUF6932